MCWRLSFSIVTLVFVIFGLLEVEALGRRLCRIGDGQVGAAAIDAATEIAARLHMLVRFGMSVLTGLCFWVFTAVCGLELHREWGVMAFILNFVPFIGSFVAILLPTLVRSRAVRIALRRSRRIRRSQPPSICHRQLRRTTRRLPLSWCCLRYSSGACYGA